jgi:hypothetical protein
MIYWSYYPQTRWWHRWIPDELEMETLLKMLEEVAPTGEKIDLHPVVSVGELVRFVAP